ncbi:LysR substrate-binding domain-containing protein [Pseudonocardia ailaonensis]|uniref:LysR substrate-binding domain-containing protein n=1 Tax=Pseudonocardia ailaonensis TaxID=367279 RepID=A0ABN2MU91_9PSEU
MQYDFTDLRLFVEVVTGGSITAGARRTHLSLPSASARVRGLEAQAGVALLVRERRGVRPTPAGVALARHAREVLAHAARLEGAVAGYARAGGAPLVLLTGSSAMHGLVPAALATFLLEHPDADVRVAERPSPETARALADGAADLGIVLADVARDTELEGTPLGDDSLVVIGAAGGVLAGRTEIDHREAAEHPMIGLDPATPLAVMIAGRAGPHAPVLRYRTLAAGLGTVVTLAAAGVGLAIVPRRAVPADLRLEVCDLREPWAHRELMLCAGATADQAAPAFRGLVTALTASAAT